ncbi:hypothetical protein [Candidatus Berkiella aquae]|uniref:Uncharacterized protein n=1 Tax=Candidatus Berkiella aquae TaxID=295108 RepID=A0A0Q9YZ16_9GAMM|nr:hypothetical protein [Candidatus Berkiella aquae]MCS5711015.1 hypothetical protein [Candidatus Berkiella aquae]
MEKLTPFAEDKKQIIEKRIEQILGSFTDNEGKSHNYFEIVNHDLEVVNHLLEHPTGASDFYQKAYNSQQEFNQAMDVAKQRWEKGNKKFDIAKTVMKDLSTRKKHYLDALEHLRAAENKQKEIQDFLDDKNEDGKLKPGTSWWQLNRKATEQDHADGNRLYEQLRTIAKKLDIADKGEREKLLEQILNRQLLDDKQKPKTWLIEQAALFDKRDNKKRQLMLQELFSHIGKRAERLKQLRLGWQSQGVFVHSSTENLIKIKREINNFKALLDHVYKSLPTTNALAIDKQIKKQLEGNRAIINRYLQQIEASAIWRIRGAAQYGNLRLDDALFVLKREIAQSVFQFDDKATLESLADIVSVSVESLGLGSSFKCFQELHQLLLRSTYAKEKEIWFNSKWVTDSDKRNIIPVTVKSGAIIPSILLSYIPENNSYIPGNWLRYWFFRTSQSLNGLAGWMRNRWLGDSCETVTLINETYRHVANFEKSISEGRAQNKALNLLHIGQSAAFLDALEITEYIENEKRRVQHLMGSSILWRFLGWVPFLKFNKNMAFKDDWLNELNRAQRAINEKATKIAEYMMEDFEALLLDSIEHKSFLMPANLMNNIEQFINRYGSQSDLQRLQKISSPMHLVSRFRFLLPANNGELFRSINEDHVTSFLRFTEKYWNAEQQRATKLIVGIITKEQLPKNADEDHVFFEQIKCLLPEQSSQVAFNQLMQKIAREYVFVTGDNGNDDCFHFLERFASNAARTWQAHRGNNMDEKFIFLNNLLSVARHQEKDLTTHAVQEIGSTQFKLQNYNRYIKDLQQEKDDSGRIGLLKKQARHYVNKYLGDNLHYADLLFNLGEFPDDTFIIQYCEKRFSWMVEQENLNADIINNEAEEKFIAKIKQYPVLVDKLVKIVNEKAIAQDHLGDWILQFNIPKLTAAYFGKCFYKHLSDNQFKQILEESEFYGELLQNPRFSYKIYRWLAQKMTELVQESNWEQLCSPDFFNIVEKIGTLENKEAYRLLRIKHLLQLNNSSLTEAYISKMAQELGAADLPLKMFTLPNGKRLLGEMLTEHLSILEQNKRWEGHAQYFVEFYLPEENKSLRHNIRLKWLAEFISKPQRFSGISFIERSTLDGKYHCDNKQIPNDEMSLTEFYGEENMFKVRELIMNRLDLFSENLSDEMIQLINAYYRDPAFNLQDDWPLFRKKCDLFQRAQRLIHCFKNNLFIDGLTQLENFYAELLGMQALATTEHGRLHQQIAVYQQQLFNQILAIVKESYSELFINQRLIDDKLAKSDLSELKRQQDLLTEMIAKSNLPHPFKYEIEEISEQTPLCMTKLRTFVSNMSFDRLHLIAFDIDDLQMYSKILNKNAKEYLKVKINTLKDYLPADDALFKALTACYQILKGEYSSRALQRTDFNRLMKYQATRQDYPRMAQEMADRLILALNAHEELTYFPLFKEAQISYQSAFVQYLSSTTKQRMLVSIKNKIEWLMMKSDPHQAQYARVDWFNHAKLLTGLVQASSSQGSEIKEVVNRWCASCLSEINKNLYPLLEKFEVSSRTSKNSMAELIATKNNQPSLIDKEQQLIKLSLFIRTFGDKKHKEQLDELLREVARHQHRTIMKGLNGPIIEHSLDFADKILSTAGSESQREQCMQLVDKWSLYRRKPATQVLQTLRAMAVNDALLNYIHSFERTLYTYFVKKHNLPDNFHEMMSQKMEEWGVKECLLEPERILKKHPLTEFQNILSQLAISRSHRFFYSKPSLSDGRKLFVAFCLNIQAKQLTRLWKNRQTKHEDEVATFNPADISGSLSNLIKQMIKKYDIGWGDFNKGVFKAIAKDTDYFVSWANAAPEQKRGSLRL